MGRQALLTALVGAAAILYASPSAAAADPLHALAAKYAPVVRLSEQIEPCAGGEGFEPIDVNALFGKEDVALRGPWSGSNIVMVGPKASDLASGRHGYSLDFPGDPLSSSACSYEEWERRITVGHRPTVYAHVASEDGRRDCDDVSLLRPGGEVGRAGGHRRLEHVDAPVEAEADGGEVEVSHQLLRLAQQAGEVGRLLQPDREQLPLLVALRPAVPARAEAVAERLEHRVGRQLEDQKLFQVEVECVHTTEDRCAAPASA